MARLPVDILLYIASLRFLTLNDIVQWRATASIFYHSIPMPSAAMILQAAFLFQIRPQRGHREQPPMSPVCNQTSFHPKNSSSASYPHHAAVPPRKDLYVIYRDRELQEVISRLTTLLTHPEFHPRLMRCSYSFRHNHPHDHTLSGSGKQSQRRRERTRRDLYDYPIFLTGNPPDLVRLAIEFGHVPFVDHLLSRGFRPRDLPEYFTMIPFMMPESDDVLDLDEDITEDFGIHHQDSEIETKRTVARARHQQRQAVMMKRSLELSQIWECMRVANQELMDACSRADLAAVLKVLDSTLINPRMALDDPAELEQLWLDPRPEYKGKGKQKAVPDPVEYEDMLEGQSRHDSIGTGSVEHDDNIHDVLGAGIDMFAQEASTSRQLPSLGTPRFPGSPGSISVQQGSNSQQSSQPSSSTQPLLIHRASIFKPRERVESTSGYAPSSGSSNPDLYSKTFTNTDNNKPNNQLHQPWIDGRALTSALLAICFRRDGVESPQAQAAEEAKAVPIIQEILKYDCMLTAQALGQAALGVVFSRPLGSLQRAQLAKCRLPKRPKGDIGKEVNEFVGVTAMDLLMERMGPREWLKLIKCFLQRREFEDLAVILEKCPFKGPQLETKEKTPFKSHADSGSTSLASSSNAGSTTSLGAALGQRHQSDAAIVRELLCREAGICGVGSRLNNFTGRGMGQTSCHVSSTLHESSHVLFTGSGTRFSHSFMLPRGGFRGIGGNSSGHTGAASNHGQAIETESYHGAEDALSDGAGVGDQEKMEAPRPYHAGGPPRRHDDQEQHDEVDEEEEEMGVTQDQDDAQDSNLAFGGVGSSTTSSCRPGPGIAGIAIQVQAPDHILKALLKMGFRFFSICDLSISDRRHPLALQFRHQEKVNRQLIEFCMVPNLDGHGGLERDWADVDETREDSGHAEEVLTNSHGRRRRRYQRQVEIDPSDFQHHAEVVYKFLYPAASNPNRGSVSIPALPSFDRPPRGAQRLTTSELSSAPPRPPVHPTPRAPSPLPVATRPPPPSTTGQPSLTPSNKVQFVLPPVQLGESFESVTGLAATFDINNVVLDDEMPLLRLRFPPLPLRSARYSKTRLSKSMPLPIRASMIELRKTGGESSFFFGGIYDEEDEEEAEEARRKAVESHHRMVQETTTRRVREHLSSDYIDLMTVGICLYQACYHRKEHLLGVLLENRLLIAQDALTGAVQVAGSVGWKRGLEMLLMQHGDMEAEVEPTVTTNSEHVHLGTSMKWDHASAVQLYPGGNTGSISNMHQGNRTFHNYTDGGNHNMDGAPGSGNTTQSLDGLLGRGIRRHQSDSGRLHQLFRDNKSSSSTGQPQPPPPPRRASFDFSRTPMFFSSSSPASESPTPPSLFTPVLPGSASAAPRLPAEMPTEGEQRRSFKSKLSMLLPNISSSLSGSSSASASHVPPNFPTKKQLETRRGSLGSLGGMVTTTTTAATGGGLYPITTTTEVSSTTMIMLSTSGLWSLPNTMMLRKSRNAVVALMAACTRNDPSLVRWLVESFADIKVPHVMQALMIACDRGLVRVAKVLVGVRSSRNNDQHQEQNKSRVLFREWLESQRQRILALTTSWPSPAAVAATAEDPNHDSFPFLFLMESSPLLRHYFQILNTLSTCQFMSWKPPTTTRALRRTPQEIKYSMIQVLLTPLLDVLGPIAVRKALNRMPKDCWWPVDPDVRAAIDQEASRAMVQLASVIRHQRKVLQQSNRKRQMRQSLELDIPLLAKVAMNNVVNNKSSAAEDEGAEGGGYGDEKAAKSTKGKWKTRVRKWIVKKRQPAPFVGPASAVVVVANFDIEKGAPGVDSEVPVIKRGGARGGEPGARPKSFFKRMSLHIKK
ncbi:hypothetical protein BG005_001016 [Podila minutissima]|nr:hypothetical protein BG005_001016 [Podila minutissima]